MTRYEIYVFFLCLIVFILLVTLFSVLLTILVKQRLKLVRGGLEDDALKIEYTKQKEKSQKFAVCGFLISLLISVVFVSFFVFSLFVNLREDVYFRDIPTMKVVNTGSMSQKNRKNQYLFDNNLDNQFQAFDLIFVYDKPAEKDLALYDVIVYESNEQQIIHRIVGIEEPNESHPDQRYFLCQGDALEQTDYFPVYYSQIKAIYKDQQIPFIGSFVKFMQSPAGWLCVILIVFGIVGMPILEKKLENEQLARLKAIGFIKDSDEGGSPLPGQEEVKDETLV